MKKILEKGTKEPPKEKIYVMKCDVCGCKYTYQEKDTYFSGYYDSDYVKCPQCNNPNFYFFKRRYRGKK